MVLVHRVQTTDNHPYPRTLSSPHYTHLTTPCAHLTHTSHTPHTPQHTSAHLTHLSTPHTPHTHLSTPQHTSHTSHTPHHTSAHLTHTSYTCITYVVLCPYSLNVEACRAQHVRQVALKKLVWKVNDGWRRKEQPLSHTRQAATALSSLLTGQGRW